MTSTHSWITLLAVLSMTLISSTVAAAPSMEASSVKVYKGTDAVSVIIVRLSANASPKEALVKISGSDSELDGKVLLVEITAWNDNQDFATYQLGKGRYILISDRRGQLELYLPGKSGRSVALKIDEKKTSEAKAEPVIAEYQAAHKAKAQ